MTKQNDSDLFLLSMYGILLRLIFGIIHIIFNFLSRKPSEEPGYTFYSDQLHTEDETFTLHCTKSLEEM